MKERNISNHVTKIHEYVSILFALLRGYTTKNIDGGEGVLIIEGGHIGDMLMDATALYTMITYYRKSGKKVSMICSPPLWDMLLRCYELHDVDFIGKAFSYEHSHYENVRNVVKEIKGKRFEIIIGINNAQSRVAYLMAAIPAKMKWGVIQQENNGIKSKIKRFAFHCCYTNIIWGDKRRYQIRYLCDLMKELHIEYVAQNVFLPPKQEIQTMSHPYIVIAVDSAKHKRLWPIQNFIDLIHLLIKKYDADICLIGTNVSQDTQNQLEIGLQDVNQHIINMIGKTSLSEWIELIRGSNFLIGVDSGSIHVAAAVGTPAFCLSGVWTAYKCMPYDVDIVTDGTELPVCVYRSDTDVDSLPCFDCESRGGAGCGNAECAVQIKAGGSYLCLSRITPDDVMKEIVKSKQEGIICL